MHIATIKRASNETINDQSTFNPKIINAHMYGVTNLLQQLLVSIINFSAKVTL